MRSLPLPLMSILFASPAFAQGPVPVVEEGDAVVGVGVVTRIDNLAINNSGTTLVEVDTDNGDTDADSALLRNGALELREGQGLVLPLGASLSSFDSVNLNANGDSAWNFFLDGTTSIFDDSGLYFNAGLRIQEGDPSTAPEFSASTPYIGFFDVKLNDFNQLLVVASFDDPVIATSVDRGLMRIDLDGSGAVISENAFLKEEDPAPGAGGATITDFGTGPHESAINNSGDILFAVDLTGGSSSQGIYLNSSPLALQGMASPVAGRSWTVLSSSEMDLNNAGDHVFSGTLDGPAGTNLLIVKNGTKFRQQGDTLPAIGGGFVLANFGTGPLWINDEGEVLWFGDWDDPNTDVDSGLFIDDELIVQEGVTTIGGVVIDTLAGTQDGYAMSRNGRFVLFEATLEDGTNGAYLIERRLGTNYCVGAVNSTGNGVQLSGEGSSLLANQNVVLRAEGLPPGVPGIFFFGPNQVQVSFGDGFRCVGGATRRIQPVATAGGSGVTMRALNFTAPYAAFLAPGSSNFQLWYRDPSGPGGTGFNLSDGLEIVFE